MVDYLLNLDHPKGGAKARFFLGCGFRRDQPEALTAALMDHPARHPAEPAGFTPFGQKFIVEGLMLMPSGRTPRVRTVWMVRLDMGVPHFVSAYPR